MNRLNWPHAEQQEDCSSIWGQQLRRRGHQTESLSVLQEDRIYPSIEVVAPKRTTRRTGSQCRTSRRSGVTWSYFLLLHSSLAAALRTDCRQSRRYLGAPTSRLL